MQKLACFLVLGLVGACSRGSHDAGLDDEEPGLGVAGSGGGGGGSNAPEPLPQDTPFVLNPEFEGPCEKAGAIDVNRGNAPEQFVRAAQCQITGTEPDAATVTDLAGQLRTQPHVRRVDVVRTLCERIGKTCTLAYSDPWQQQVDLTASCIRKGTRDVGAVLMYWSQCGETVGVNCGMDWANTHASGMLRQHALLAFGDQAQGYYNPQNPGFWRRELLDARWAGLQFLLLNTFGPDLSYLPSAVQAIENIGGGIGLALFDDTWGWGKGGDPWGSLPDFNDTEGAAQLIYVKWQQFYRAIPTQHWYRFQGKPLIAFYNAGTLKPENKSAATLARLKQLFQSEFGEEPFLAVDRAFFQDAATPNVADSQFRWNTFSNNEMSLSEMRGVSFAHFMPKWDAMGRDNRGAIASASDQIIKGPELLERYLTDSSNADLAVIATWNDLGEGTGISRNYDYYYEGEWLPPHAFMGRIRAAQCQ